MTDPKALIAEALKRADALSGEWPEFRDPDTADILRRLVAAVRGLAVDANTWRQLEAANDRLNAEVERLATALEEATKARMTFAVSGGWKAIPDPISRETMAALDGEEKTDGQ